MEAEPGDKLCASQWAIVLHTQRATTGVASTSLGFPFVFLCTFVCNQKTKKE